MGIFKGYWRQLWRFAGRTFLFRLLSVVVIAALIFGLFVYYKSSEQMPSSHGQRADFLGCLGMLPQSQRKCCFDNQAVLFFSLPGAQSLSSLLLPFIQFTAVKNIPYLEVETDGMKWKAAALKTDSVGMLIAEFSKEVAQEKLLPLISVVLDSNGTEYLLLVGKEGQVSLSSMKFLIEHFLVDFKGRSSVEVRIPREWGNNGEHIPFYLNVH